MNARDVLSRLRLENGDRWIDRAADWQLEDVLAALEGVAPFNFETRPRGGSKTTDNAGVALAWLLTAPAGSRFFGAAADRDQARLLLDAAAGFARRSPALASKLKIEAHKVTAIETGSTFETLAADAASSWGILPSGIVIDEIAWWQDTPLAHQLLDSLLSSAAKVDGCRVLVITAPSSPGHFSYKLKQHAAEDPLWRLSERAGAPPPWLPPERVEEQRKRLSEPMFRRLFLGEWAEGDEQLALAGDVDAAIAHEGPLEPVPGVTYAIGLDLGVKKDRTAAMVVHRDGERIVIDRKALWKGSRLRPVKLSEVEDWIGQASKAYSNAEVIADPWQAISMVERLRESGIRVHEFTFSSASVGKLAGVMADLLRNRQLAIPDDEELIDELRAVKLVEKSPGSFRLDHDAGKHDDQVIALSLGAQHLLRTARFGPIATLKGGPWQGGPLRRGQSAGKPGALPGNGTGRPQRSRLGELSDPGKRPDLGPDHRPKTMGELRAETERRNPATKHPLNPK